MLFFIQTSIKEQPHLKNSLKTIYGVGESTTRLVLKINGLLKSVRGKNLRKKQKNLIRTTFNRCNKPFARDLRQIYKINCQRLINDKNYKGIRHKLGYPVRGQRTRTNAVIQKKLHKRWVIKIDKKNVVTPKKNIKNLKKNVSKKKIIKKSSPKPVSKPSKYKV